MKLSLIPMDQPPEGICVGTLDGVPLVFHGRSGTAGDRKFEIKEIAGCILAAVEETARQVFGPEWITALSIVSGLNVRTCQRDRIGRYGIPAHVMLALADAAATPCPRAAGHVMVAYARLVRSHAQSPDPFASANASLSAVSRTAAILYLELADQRAKHRAPALADAR